MGYRSRRQVTTSLRPVVVVDLVPRSGSHPDPAAADPVAVPVPVSISVPVSPVEFVLVLKGHGGVLVPASLVISVGGVALRKSETMIPDA